MMPRQNISRILLPFLVILVALGAGTAVFTLQSAGAAPTGTPDILFTSAYPNLNFNRPVDIANAGDERLFIVEQGGRIHIVGNDPNITTTDIFLDIRDRVDRNTGDEMGLLGLVFHPDYANNGYFFVNYTRSTGSGVSQIIYTRISRFSVQPDNPNEANPDSEQVILEVVQPYRNHNAGDLAFGPDGYLYIPLGDGGSAGDPENRAQNRQTLLGKILRIDVDKTGGGSPECSLSGDYTIPADNPFVGEADVCDEIWALGLRNPWRFAFDAETNDLFIGDVGQGQWEEINRQPASSSGGENYGWDIKEGNTCFGTESCDETGLTSPIYDYSHSATGGLSVTGGFVYRGSSIPTLEGHYIFVDYVLNQLWSLTLNGAGWVKNDLGTLPSNLVYTFGEDMNGEIYFAANRNIYRIDSATPFSRLNLAKEAPLILTNLDPFTYTLTVESTGTQLTTNVVMTDTIPVGTSFVDSNGTLDGDVVTWRVDEMAIGDVFTGTLVVQPLAGGLVTNELYGVLADEATVVGGETAVSTIIADAQSFLPVIIR